MSREKDGLTGLFLGKAERKEQERHREIREAESGVPTQGR